MLTDRHLADLDKKGYVVVDNVLSHDLCDLYSRQYMQWTDRFTKDGHWPFSSNSLIQRYKVGHMDATWRIRLATKRVFAKLWQTEKLLSSFDAIAIGRPPEESVEEFQRPNQHWLHTDQSANQIGLHTIQGALYLETADSDDWTFVVLEKSHELHQEFMASHPKACLRSSLNYFYRLRDGEKEWFESKGCEMRRVPVPKGGMVLWDSRLIHANAKPLVNRKNRERWRRVVFVCMGPAVWASKEDLLEKAKAYNNVQMTTHFPCQHIAPMPENVPSYCQSIMAVDELPPIARSTEARLLAGVLNYVFTDGRANGPKWVPHWRFGYNPKYNATPSRSVRAFMLWFGALAMLFVSIIFYMYSVG